MSSRQILQQIATGLRQAGLDIVHPFQVQNYNQAIRSTSSSVHLPSLPTFHRPSTFAILIGNTKNIWDPFIADLLKRDNVEAYLRSEPNPFDQFVSTQINKSLQGIQANYEIRYSYDVQEEFVHFLLLSHVSGLAYLNKVRSPRSFHL